MRAISVASVNLTERNNSQNRTNTTYGQNQLLSRCVFRVGCMLIVGAGGGLLSVLWVVC